MADPMDQPDRSTKPAASERGRPAGGKISNSLVALSSAAVLTVYAAGYVRTRSAAERFAVEAADLRTAVPLAGAAATAAPPREFVDAVKAAEPPAAPPAARQAQYKDGTYSGWGYSRHGDIQASVSVQDGRIVAAQITQCLTRYSCDVIDMLPSQVIGRQNAFVDLISGATESANAFSNAIYRALAMSK